MELEIKDLHVEVEGKEILKGLNLKVRQGEIHALMGPNGSGKSTLSLAIMGHPKYAITKGDILLDGRSVLEMSPDERAKTGLFLSFQYPSEVPGVSLSDFLRTAYNNIHNGQDKNKFTSVLEFRTILQEKMRLMNFDPSFASRYLNEGFSGGEKKRGEILQLSVLKPRMAIMDETDSGLDIDALQVIADGVNRLMVDKTMGTLLITHYERILKYIKPDYVHVLIDGKIVKSGGKELAQELEAKGYKWLMKEFGFKEEDLNILN